MRLQFQKRSALKLVSRIIPQSGGYNTPQFLRGSYPWFLIFSKGRMKGVLVLTGQGIKTPAYAVLITFLNLFTKWVSGFVLL
jgi:hypothetical protein